MKKKVLSDYSISGDSVIYLLNTHSTMCRQEKK